MKDRVSRYWIPFWADKWLYGSLRLEFNAEERGIWADLLALATKDDGWIRANEDIGYPIDHLAGILRIPKETLKKAINKFIRKDKLERHSKGILYIKTWEKYAFTDRHKRRLIAQMSGKTDTMSGKTDTREEKRREEKKREEKKRNNKQQPKVTFSFEKKEFLNIKEEDLKGWKEAYPACDIELELKKMREWLLANPHKRKKNYKRFITNWLNKTQDRGGSKGGQIKGWAERRGKSD